MVTKVESLETDPVYLIETDGNEMWAPLKDVRRLNKMISTQGERRHVSYKICEK